MVKWYRAAPSRKTQIERRTSNRVEDGSKDGLKRRREWKIRRIKMIKEMRMIMPARTSQRFRLSGTCEGRML